MTPQNVQTTLRQALWVIQKLADSLGLDEDELNENYKDVTVHLTEAIKSLEGEK